LLGFGWWIWVVVATIEAAAVGLKDPDRKVTDPLAENISSKALTQKKRKVKQLTLSVF